MIRGKKAYKVELVFDAAFAETISDTHWHRTQQVDWQDDDSIVFRCKVDGLDEIVWWIMSMGPHCTVASRPHWQNVSRNWQLRLWPCTVARRNSSQKRRRRNGSRRPNH